MMSKKKSNTEIISCGAVTWRFMKGIIQILLIKQFHDKDLWGIPKGHINDNETIPMCAIREVFEETGVLISLTSKLRDCVIPQKNKKKIVMSYLAVPLSHDEPKHDGYDSEVADARWFNFDQLPNIVSYQQNLIREACDLIFEQATTHSMFLKLMK